MAQNSPKLLSFIALVTFHARAAAEALILSPGLSPLANRHSQFLQTRALQTYLQSLSNQRTRVFFGAGNREGSAAEVADVHQRFEDGELKIHELTVGRFKDNEAATLEHFEKNFYLKTPTQLQSREPLFLFVAGHGRPGEGAIANDSPTFANNCIDMWGYETKGGDGFEEHSKEKRCLSVKKLESLFNGLPTGTRGVFEMAQCYSGGFHRMSVKNISTYPSANVELCGFTAATEDETSSGCTADTAGPSYRGYERFFTEQLSGRDVESGERLRPARTSLLEAHEAASLQDDTKDIPLTTLDFYLWKWGLRMLDPKFRPRAGLEIGRACRTKFLEAFSGLTASGSSEVRRRSNFISRQTNLLRSTHPELEFLGENASLGRFEAVLKKLETERLALVERSFVNFSIYQKAEQTLQASWAKAFRANNLRYRTEDEKNLEVAFQAIIDHETAPKLEPFLILYMARTAPFDPGRSRAAFTYLEQRKLDQTRWGLAHAELLQPVADSRRAKAEFLRLDELARRKEISKGLVRRLMIYKMALAALDSLETLGDAVALQEIAGLSTCLATTL